MAGAGNDDPIDRLLDVFLYAPIGLLATGGERLDEFVAKGRQQATIARTLGAFALAGADDRLTRSLDDLEGMAREFFRVVIESTSSRPRSSESSPEGSSATTSARSVDDVIEGYDDLTAKQVIERLPGLDDGDLEIVEQHERTTRERSTVLARIARLRD